MMDLLLTVQTFFVSHPGTFWLLVCMVVLQLANTALMGVVLYKSQRKDENYQRRLDSIWEKIKTLGQNLAGVLELDV